MININFFGIMSKNLVFGDLQAFIYPKFESFAR
jgi:hypothetical protein